MEKNSWKPGESSEKYPKEKRVKRQVKLFISETVQILDIVRFFVFMNTS